MSARKKSHSFVFRNSLSLTLAAIVLVVWSGQAVAGWKEKNEELRGEGLPVLDLGAYLRTDHFWSATSENWESEFLQMGMYVLLTIGLRQKGSSESKQLEGKEEVDREPKATPDAPWPVRKGGLLLGVYRHSLSIAFLLLFAITFNVHLHASWGEYNAGQLAKGLTAVTKAEYLGMPRFWFESLQNWQSEFLAVLAIVVLSIYLRQQGSPESKPVDAPHNATGGG